MLLFRYTSIGSKKLSTIAIITRTPPTYLNLKGNISIDKTPFLLLAINTKNETMDVTSIADIMKEEYIVFGICN